MIWFGPTVAGILFATLALFGGYLARRITAKEDPKGAEDPYVIMKAISSRRIAAAPSPDEGGVAVAEAEPPAEGGELFPHDAELEAEAPGTGVSEPMPLGSEEPAPAPVEPTPTSAPEPAVMPQATLWDLHALNICWNAASTSGAFGRTPIERDRSEPAPRKIAPTPGTAAISLRFFNPSTDSIMTMASRSPSGLSGHTSARRSYSAAFTPHAQVAPPVPYPRIPSGSRRVSPFRGG